MKTIKSGSYVLLAISTTWVSLVSAALEVDFTSSVSIKSAAAFVAADLLSFYSGHQPGQTPGILPGPPPRGPYYWWQGGAMWGTMLDYWHATADESYSTLISESLIHQAGARRNYEPLNWTASLGNDDQGFWGMSAMLAAEIAFPDPEPEEPQWLELAQAVFNRQSMPERHDDACGGGMRWQIPEFNTGYDYKNAIANGCYFNIGARLARYTDNGTYARLASETWDWMEGVGMIADEYSVYDGGHVQKNCTNIFKARFSYNAAIWLQGAAFMYNYTNGDAIWEARVSGLLTNLLDHFFLRPDTLGILYEPSCENAGTDGISTCNTDMSSFKGFVHRWLATVVHIAPFTRNDIIPLLRSSAEAAVKQCTGGANGRMCGYHWASGEWDGITGAMLQMNVLGALISVLVDEVGAPLTNTTGGTSEGDYSAGTDPDPEPLAELTAGDTAGASFVTATICISATAAFAWMSTTWLESPTKV